MKIFLIAYIFTVLASCSGKDNKNWVSNAESSKKITQQVKINADSILQLNLQDAVKRYGNPLAREVFNTRDAITEFRIELKNFYPENELQEGIVIEELTWRMDSLNNITVWYVDDSGVWVPKHCLIWDKNAEF